jgi:putative DNA methylase
MYRKKLIEVSLPLAAINAESAREKSIRHGHPSTLHLWWARRPLAACRAVLFASLVDDPDSDPQYRKPDGSVDEDAAGIKRADLFNLIEELVAWENSNNPEVIRSARAEIARCIASRMVELKELDSDLELSPGDGKSSKAKTTVRDLVTRGHCRPQPMGLDKKAGRVRFSFDVSRLPPADVVNAFLAEHAPPVLDPFAGGGSIPLEAQRLGLRAYASDLNPVPVLINKALIEIPPKFAGRPPVNPEARGEGTAKGKGKKSNALIEKEWPGATGLAKDVRYYGKWMRDEAEKRIGHLYPKVEVTEEMAKDRPDLKEYVGQKLTVIAWLWARTVASPNPAANNAHVPLVRSFWLCNKKGRESWVEPVVDAANNSFRFEVRTYASHSNGKPQQGIMNRRGGRCLITNAPMSFNHIRSEAKANRMEERLMAVAVEGKGERLYLSPTPDHEALAKSASPNWRPTGAMPLKHRNFQPPVYGLLEFGDIFTARQLVALSTFCDLICDARNQILNSLQEMREWEDSEKNEYADAIATYLAFSVSKATSRNCSLAVWEPGTGFGRLAGTLGRQALPMQWAFAETNPLAGAGGDISGAAESVSKVLDELPVGLRGVVSQESATAISTESIVSCDPPYYDNIAYADLSDFFYVWLRRSLASIYPNLFSTVLAPKHDEMIASPHRHGGDKDAAKEFFETRLGLAFRRIHHVQVDDVPATIFYAFKQLENDEDDIRSDSGSIGDADVTSSTGWEVMLSGLLTAGFSINGTWPLRTEAVNALKKDISALASSIVLVCRPRPEKAPLATRKEFLTSLRRELPDALRNLQHGNIAPVDLAQAAIGPGMAVFTRYAKVLESDGKQMSVRTALGLINQTLDEVLADQEGEFDGDTRWAIAWFDQFGMAEGPFGDAETLSKAKNTAINGLVEAGIVVAKSGKVRLIRRDELPDNWNPANDKRLTVWEVTQHLIHRLDQQGESGAAELVNQLGSVGEIARDLAYRLYSTCERKKWADEALAYNGLVIVWPELTKLALSQRSQRPETQQEMF